VPSTHFVSSNVSRLRSQVGKHHVGQSNDRHRQPSLVIYCVFLQMSLHDRITLHRSPPEGLVTYSVGVLEQKRVEVPPLDDLKLSGSLVTTYYP